MKALTGNRLEDGEVVFRGQGRLGRSASRDADLFDDDDAALAAEAARQDRASPWWSIPI